MNLDNITLGELKGLQQILGNTSGATKLSNKFVGEYCVFRTYSAGVFVGTLLEREGKEAVIKDCRRIWSWDGAFTLSAVSQDGVKSAKMSISEPEKLITELVEAIPCSNKAKEQLTGMDSHEN